MTRIPAAHIINLQNILRQHARAPMAAILRRTIDQAVTLKQATNELHIALSQIINAPTPRRSLLSRWWYRRADREDLQLVAAIKSELISFQNQDNIVLIPANKPLIELDILDNLPHSVDIFAQKLFIAHIKFTEDKYYNEDTLLGNLINNALLAIKESYAECMQQYLQSSNSHERKMSAKRMLILQEWLTEEGYQTLIYSVIKSYNYYENRSFYTYFDADDSKHQHDDKQHLLNWLGIVFAKFQAQENPLAMSHIIKLITLMNLSLTSEIKQQLLELSRKFMNCYVVNDCVMPINIISMNAEKIKEEMARFTASPTSTPVSLNRFHGLKDALMAIYIELSGHLEVNNQVVTQFTELTSPLTDVKAKEFKGLIKEAMEAIIKEKEHATSVTNSGTQTESEARLNRRLAAYTTEKSESDRVSRTSSTREREKSSSSKKSPNPFTGNTFFRTSSSLTDLFISGSSSKTYQQ